MLTGWRSEVRSRAPLRWCAASHRFTHGRTLGCVAVGWVYGARRQVRHHQDAAAVCPRPRRWWTCRSGGCSTACPAATSGRSCTRACGCCSAAWRSSTKRQRCAAAAHLPRHSAAAPNKSDLSGMAWLAAQPPPRAPQRPRAAGPAPFQSGPHPGSPSCAARAVRVRPPQRKRAEAEEKKAAEKARMAAVMAALEEDKAQRALRNEMQVGGVVAARTWAAPGQCSGAVVAARARRGRRSAAGSSWPLRAQGGVSGGTPQVCSAVAQRSRTSCAAACGAGGGARRRDGRGVGAARADRRAAHGERGGGGGRAAQGAAAGGMNGVWPGHVLRPLCID